MKKINMLLASALFVLPVSADDAPFKITDNLFDLNDKETRGLSYAPGAETFTVFAPTDKTDHYSNGVVMAAFKGNLYCMWQSSAKDEDSEDTWVAYSRSTDGGVTWSEPMVLCPTISNGYCASGGWLVTNDRLIGYINTRPKSVANSGGYTQFVESTDGLTWSNVADVTMADGSQLNGIFEQDPHVLPNGRIVSAAHFQPGLKLCPIYTDDPTGRTGWKKGSFKYTDNGTQSVELEPSFFMQSDGTLVMVMRDQKGSYCTLAATSKDNGETWTKAVKTNMPDSRAKQCAGNLPDGTAYMVNNPGRVTNSSNKTWRVPLAITLSADGFTFDKAYLLRSGKSGDYPTQRYTGKAKTLGYSYPKAMVHGDYLYVSYSTNKDDAQYTRIPISGISCGISSPSAKVAFSINGKRLNIHGGEVLQLKIVDMSGRLIYKASSTSIESTIDLSSLPKGIYIISAKTVHGVQSHKISL